MKQFITRRSFIKAAGAATALTAVSVGAPAAFAEETNCFFGDKADVTILYTNDVHTYIDNKSPKPTYAAIAALKKSIEDTGRDVLLRPSSRKRTSPMSPATGSICVPASTSCPASSSSLWAAARSPLWA